MPKIRVHVLAKELGLTNKDMLDKLQAMGIEATSHMSGIDESDAKKVTDTVKKPAVQTPAAKPQQTEGRTPQPAERRSQQTGEARPEQRRNDRPQGQAQSGQRTQGQTNSRPQGQNLNGQQRPVSQNGERRPQGQGQNRPQGQNQGQRPQNQGNRPQNQGGQQKLVYGPGERRPQGQGQNRPQGQNQGQRPQGQGNNRPQGQNQGQRPQGQGQNRPQGQNQGQRPQGQGYNRPQGQGNNRPQGQGQNRPQGQGGSRPVGNRSQGQGGGRTQGAVQPQRPQRSGAPGQRKDQKPLPQRNFSKKDPKRTPRPQPQPKPEPAIPAEPREAFVPESLTVKELAAVLGRSGADLLKHMMKKGMMANINQTLEYDAAAEIALDFNVILELEQEKDIMEEAFKEEPEDEKNLKERPPVVVVMGHVDHGKTSLLDAIRHSKVTAGEAGGITQHIGAYTVDVDGREITFLDTPGHEAFTAMRMRGAQITDVAVLVVAADDGVMPQTVEAINHAKAAEVEILVAINKIDKPSANPDRVKQELTEYGLVAEDWGGDTICVPVSAHTKEGIDTLLEMILLSTEMKELRANPNKKARGAIIEAKLDKGRGPVATVLVQNGTLKVGDPIVAGQVYGRIRAMMDDKGRRVKQAGPSMPVEILGLSEVPVAGDTFYVAESEKQARSVAEAMLAKSRNEMIKNTMQKVSLDDLFSQIKAGDVKELNIVVKADVQGSVEAVRQSLEKLSNDEVRVRIIHGGVGTITESDVMLASASNAIIIGFNVRPETAAKNFADEEKVDIRLYRVIYQAIDDVKAAMTGMLDPIYEEQVQGHAEVRQTFKASGVGTIAGCYITDGKFLRNCQVRVKRDGEVIFDGDMDSLKRFKDDVKEVREGYECGIVLKKYNDIQEGDIIEGYLMVEVPRK